MEPERVIHVSGALSMIAVQVRVNRGYRNTNMNSATGPYKGGLRFHPTFNPGSAQVSRL